MRHRIGAASCVAAALLAQATGFVPSRRRKPVRYVADFIHRSHDGPDPATLPRRRRRMRVPRGYEIHFRPRAERPPVPAEKIRDWRRCNPR